jgi:hypothetical protein
MTIAFNHKLEITKVLIGLLMTCVGAWWTYTTYYENERKHELETLINLGNAIAGMHVTCKSSFGDLASLAGKTTASREGRCYQYFQEAHRISLAAVITVKRPRGSSPEQWSNYWDNLQNVIAAAGSEKYIFNDIESAWVDILVAKKLKEVVVGEA